jgi:hypothetical protein
MQKLPWVKQSSLLKWRCLTLEDLEIPGVDGMKVYRAYY